MTVIEAVSPGDAWVKVSKHLLERGEKVGELIEELNVMMEITEFQSDDWFRMASNRREQVWFAPQIGRWVVRESFGEYLWLGMTGWAQSLKEDYLRWELISWK